MIGRYAAAAAECLIDSHFDSLDLDAPPGGRLVEHGLHGARDALSVAEDLVQVLGSENVPQRGLGKEARRMVGVLHVGHGDGGVGDPVVYHGVHRHGHRVLGQNLKEAGRKPSYIDPRLIYRQHSSLPMSGC